MTYGVGVRGREGIETRELTAIARATGGWYFELKPADDVAGSMQQIADELHRQVLDWLHAVGARRSHAPDRSSK